LAGCVHLVPGIAITTVSEWSHNVSSPKWSHNVSIIEATEESDPVTNDMVIAILHDEEGHRRLFEGFLREYQDQS
jgi:bacterioferritin (cytochrome b1)